MGDRARRAIEEFAPALPHASVPAPIDAVIALAIAKDPSARHANADEMAAALRAAAAGMARGLPAERG